LSPKEIKNLSQKSSISGTEVRNEKKPKRWKSKQVSFVLVNARLRVYVFKVLR
jgi:hypothetical protein